MKWSDTQIHEFKLITPLFLRQGLKINEIRTTENPFDFLGNHVINANLSDNQH